jgi:hypothetical protein
MKTQRGNIDPGTIIGGLVLILIVGVFISIGVGLNYKVQSSIVTGLDAGSTAVANNASAAVLNSFALAANIPILIVAVLMILVLLSVAATLV